MHKGQLSVADKEYLSGYTGRYRPKTVDPENKPNTNIPFFISLMSDWEHQERRSVKRMSWFDSSHTHNP
jgi:hypothetical protein